MVYDAPCNEVDCITVTIGGLKITGDVCKSVMHMVHTH